MADVQNVLRLVLTELYSRHKGGRFGITRLMKLVYLLECAYFQLNQKRLTDLRWIYYKYGPYCSAVEGALNEMGVVEEEIEITDRKKFRSLAAPQNLNPDEHPELREIRGLAGRIAQEWGVEDLNKLLNHVYFETAPMRYAKRGEEIDISLAVEDTARPRRAKWPELDKKTLREMRARIRKAGGAAPDQPVQKLRFLSDDDPDFQRAMAALNAEGHAEGLTGSRMTIPFPESPNE